MKNLKGLTELRNDKVVEMQALVDSAKEEVRAMSEEEVNKFNALENEIRDIDATINAEERARGLEMMEIEKEKPEERAIEEANLLKFLKGEERALDVANNGGIIPTSIANKIIKKVKELSPVYAMSTIYNVGGDLVFPVYDETTAIQASYIDDLTELTEQTGKFTTVKLQNFIIGALAKVSKSLMNRTDFDLVSYVINKVAQAIAEKLERECLIGTTDKMTGVFSSANVVTTASSTAITADELIDLQMTVPEVYQGNAVWIMNKATFKAIRKLKDGQGNFLLNKDATMKFGWELLGKSVYVSENAPTVAASNKVIVYGDMSGLYTKLAQNVEIQVLLEKYATQHAVGVVGYVEADSKIIEPQKLAVLQMKAA